MQARLLFRTHYQVEEPAYMEFLIKCCSSATQSTYTEVVAARLKEEIERRCQTRFNMAAGGYAVDLARALGLLTQNNTWTEKGHLVNLIAEVNDGEPDEQLSLNPAEKLLHFRLFLEADGAALVLIARYLKEHSSLAHAEAMTSSFIEDMFVEIFSAYLSMTGNVADRVALRGQIDQLKPRGYAGKTRQHKLHIHMQTLYRLDLVERLDRPDGIIYRLPEQNSGNKTGLETFLCEVPDLPTLEKRMATCEWARIASKVLKIPYVVLTEIEEEHRNYILSLLVLFYQQVMLQGTPICPLSTVIEAIQIHALIEHGWLLEYGRVMKSIVDEQKQSPKDIRFHVDRRGRPAFIRLSKRWTTSVGSQ